MLRGLFLENNWENVGNQMVNLSISITKTSLTNILCGGSLFSILASVQQMHSAVITFNLLIESNISLSYLNDAE